MLKILIYLMNIIKKFFYIFANEIESMRIGYLAVKPKNNFGIKNMISEPKYKRNMETNRWLSKLPSEQSRESHEHRDWKNEKE